MKLVHPELPEEYLCREFKPVGDGVRETTTFHKSPPVVSTLTIREFFSVVESLIMEGYQVITNKE